MHGVHERELHAQSAGSMQHACFTRGFNTAHAHPAGARRDSMCCAQPAAQQREIDRGWLQERISNKKIMRKLSEKRLKISAHALLEGTKGREIVQGRPGWTIRGPRSARDRPKIALRAPKSVPRTAQQRPKSAQESNKSGQEVPKRSPRPPQERPRRVQEESEVRPKRQSSQTSKKPRFFHLFSFWLRDTGAHQKSRKIVKNRSREEKKSIKIVKLRARKPR